MNKKNDLPAMPFYFGDWFKATDVQSLSRETKCVWFEMLGRMWESNERGFLTINGKPMSNFAKAKVLGFGEDVEKYLQHEKILEDNGIFSRREDGAIYSRFMLKMLEISEKRSNAGKRGQFLLKQKSSKQLKNSQTNAEIEYETETEYETKIKKEEKQKNEMPEKLNTPEFILIWNEFKKMRKEIKRPLRATAEKTQLKKLLDFDVGIAMKMVEQSTANQWQGIFELKGNGNGNNTAKPVSAYNSRLSYKFDESKLAERAKELEALLDKSGGN